MPPRSIALLAAFAAVPAFAGEGEEFFEKKVRPILLERCMDCHSPDKKVKGGLRLDTREGWMTGGDSGPAIVPGDPEKSLFITAIRYTDLTLQMPEKRKLPDAEIAVLEQWVKMGAPDPRTGGVAVAARTGLSVEEGKKFWSYAPVVKPAVPNVKDAAWARNAIDRFTLSKMEEAGVKPSPDAAPEVLARRAHLVLTGLPPSPEQSADFAAAGEAGREGKIDELLASRHFGERFGRHWLDVARFAESSGGGRTLLYKDAWRYRDYVIEAFNSGMPYDRFIREQIAGDLLPAEGHLERRRQLTATAFLVLGPTNYEEQEKQQLRFDVIDEQLDTMGKAFMGQTIGCARCHDHKFDPIPQKDYYALAGIFASTRTLFNYTDNVARWIATPLPGDAAAEREFAEHEAKVGAMREELGAMKAQLSDAQKAVSAASAKPGKSVPAGELPGIVLDDSDAKVVGNWKASKFVRSFVGEGYLHDENDGKGEKTITFSPAISQAGRYDVRLAYAHASGRADNVRVEVLHADGEDTVFVDQSQPPPIDGRFVSLGKFRFEKDGAGYVLISNESTTNYVTVDALQLLPEGGGEVLDDGKSAGAKSEMAKRVKQMDAELKELLKAGPPRENAMTVEDDAKPAPTQIRVRGIEKQRGEKVPRGFLQVAMIASTPGVSDTQSGRKELADWLASAENPLTARVFVNRVWTWLFGEGLVRTVDNFGTTGEKPTHPELLDYLAARFMEEGWNVKWLVREIVSSRTWQQAVAPPSESDPDNRLLAHANRRRLDAEQIRDAILFASGKLDLTYLGPNIEGAGEIDANNFSAQDIEYKYKFTDTRRGVYVPAFRNKRLDLFEAFDFGDNNASYGQRPVSTVAPQALYFLNHTFVAGQARAAAERTMATPGTAEERLERAYRSSLGRAPTSAEREKCLAFLGTEPSLETWSILHQTLFACVDFRYIE